MATGEALQIVIESADVSPAVCEEPVRKFVRAAVAGWTVGQIDGPIVALGGGTRAYATSRTDDTIGGTVKAPAGNLDTDPQDRDSRERPARMLAQRREAGNNLDGVRRLQCVALAVDVADSRERPAPISAPAGVTHKPSSLLSSLPPAGAVTVNAREGRR